MILREPLPDRFVDRSILVFDVDGVLNGHERHANGYCGTKPGRVTRMNRIIAATDCLLVVSSAWRYLVLNGHMTVVGLENLFLTHGLDCRGRIVGVTRRDADSGTTDRGDQIREFLDTFRGGRGPAVVVDDRDDLGLEQSGLPIVQTDEWAGLTDIDVERIVKLLGAKQTHHQEEKPRQWRRD